MRDFKSLMRLAIGLVPALRASSVLTPTGVDVSDADSVTILLSSGVITDGTHTVSVEESDDNVTFTAVPAGLLLGAFTALTSSAGGSAIQTVGYIGNKRYLRTPVTVTGSPSTGGLYSTQIVKTNLRKYP